MTHAHSSAWTSNFQYGLLRNWKRIFDAMNPLPGRRLSHFSPVCTDYWTSEFLPKEITHLTTFIKKRLYECWKSRCRSRIGYCILPRSQSLPGLLEPSLDSLDPRLPLVVQFNSSKLPQCPCRELWLILLHPSSQCCRSICYFRDSHQKCIECRQAHNCCADSELGWDQVRRSTGSSRCRIFGLSGNKL